MADTGLEEIIIVHESYKVSQAATYLARTFSTAHSTCAQRHGGPRRGLETSLVF
jgi:hypothetical protein